MIGTFLKERYLVLEAIGQGSQSNIYMTKDSKTDRFVALRVLHGALEGQQDLSQQLQRYATALEQFDSSRIVKVLDFGHDQGIDFIVTEYLSGPTLQEVITQDAPLETARAVRIARDIAQTLDDANTLGLVHHDLRPANVTVLEGDAVRIRDLGLAAVAGATPARNTPYLAPELAEGQAGDIQADIYSLGVILFEMMAGRLPDDTGETGRAHVPIAEIAPSSPTLDEQRLDRLNSILDKCLAHDPAARYTPPQLVDALSGMLVEMGGVAGLGDSLVGQTLGRYQIRECIGQGGMSVVYKAYQPGLDRYVAIKVLSPQLTHDPDFAARFRREARAIARLDHPNILPVYDFGQEGRLSYIVMKYVESGTLKDLLGEPLSLDLIAGLVGQIAGALDAAHAQGIVHRDVKPTNILISPDKWAMLADFGLARMSESSVKLTNSGSSMGTPAYMSPEQAQGLPVDGRSDLYSLGIVVFEMLTGKVPYEADTPMAVAIKHITEPMPGPSEFNADIPKSVERVVLKALAKSPADRYESAGKFAQAFKNSIQATQSDAPEVCAAPPVSEQVSTATVGQDATPPGLEQLPPAIAEQIAAQLGAQSQPVEGQKPPAVFQRPACVVVIFLALLAIISPIMLMRNWQVMSGDNAGKPGAPLRIAATAPAVALNMTVAATSPAMSTLTSVPTPAPTSAPLLPAAAPPESALEPAEPAVSAGPLLPAAAPEDMQFAMAPAAPAPSDGLPPADVLFYEVAEDAEEPLASPQPLYAPSDAVDFDALPLEPGSAGEEGPLYSPPHLLDPADGYVSVDGRVDFRWDWDGNLEPDECFELAMSGEQDGLLRGATGCSKEKRASLNVLEAAHIKPGPSGAYFWTVRINRRSPAGEWTTVSRFEKPRKLKVGSGNSELR